MMILRSEEGKLRESGPTDSTLTSWSCLEDLVFVVTPNKTNNKNVSKILIHSFADNMYIFIHVE